MSWKDLNSVKKSWADLKEISRWDVYETAKRFLIINFEFLEFVLNEKICNRLHKISIMIKLDGSRNRRISARLKMSSN